MVDYRGAAPLNERVEFFSTEWIAAAEAELQKIVRRHPEALAGVDYSLSEAFSDAPPHLGAPEGRVGWTLRFSGGGVTVERRPDEAADMVVAGQYQAAMPVAQAVGPIATARAAKLAAHLFGKKALRGRGAPPPPGLALVLRELHDHLARRTVENPDLTHRLGSQGLKRKARELARDGYTVLENAIPHDIADELRELSLDIMLSHKSPGSRNGRIDCMGLISRGRAFEEIVQHPTLRSIAESSLGGAMILQTVSSAMKAPGPSAVPAHADYVAVPAPYPKYALVGVAVWALDDWTVEAGPTWIIPGSQKRRRPPEPGDNLEGGVPILMPKGSVTFFTQGVWHWQGDRTAPGERVSLHNTYQRPFMRQADDFSNIDAVLHRNSPVLSTLTGHDDYFGRSDYMGHDFKRSGYMSRRQRWDAQLAL
ncbi:phytanoyl-CoA dioxygenase family protein [uncultured Phenylobacterium sp.]|uniref:phytanoyl-CoA dioxygenase family protein n=1 Tax=uncultured Phenylobacterium sp. TaxID=349273 RepID=UPI0025DBA332|nr:phytanoyl-CoA dioxygenase family protein [uncultured Phenylobacterium sp.]